MNLLFIHSLVARVINHMGACPNICFIRLIFVESLSTLKYLLNLIITDFFEKTIKEERRINWNRRKR